MIIFLWCIFFFFKQKTAYEIVSGDWSSDVCSSDLGAGEGIQFTARVLPKRSAAASRALLKEHVEEDSGAHEAFRVLLGISPHNSPSDRPHSARRKNCSLPRTLC